MKLSFLLMVLTLIPSSKAEQPIAVLLQHDFGFDLHPIDQMECIKVSSSGMANISMRIQATAWTPVQIDAYTVTLNEKQFSEFKRDLHSADAETLPVFIAPVPALPIREASTFTVTTFPKGTPKQVGYSELETEDHRNANDSGTVEQIRIAKPSLAPLQRWARSLDIKAAVHQNEPSSFCD